MNGLVKCPKCESLYFPGVTEDETDHLQYCDLVVNGAPLGALEDERVVWAKAGDFILLVTDSSSEKARELAQDVSRCANREICNVGGIYRVCDPPDERRVHIFLYVCSSRAVGMCLIERRSKVWRCTWNANDVPICVEQGSMWSVGVIWVLKKHRRTGIAHALFKEVKRVLNLGEDDIGWYTPFSEEGKTFVRRHCPTHYFVAK